MIKFAICDDDVAMGVELEQVVIDILTNLKQAHDVDVLFSPAEVEKQMANGVAYDFMFLDIEYLDHEKNGVELAKFIRDVHENNQVTIVFISRESKYALELFQVHPLDFLLKPLKREVIEKVIMKYLNLVGLWKKTFSYKIGRQIYTVQLKDIVYLENVGRKVHLHLADGQEVAFYGALTDVYETQLQNSDFLFIHVNYAVNYAHMETKTFDHVQLKKSGLKLPISKRRRDEVRTLYQRIIERRAL